MTNTFYLLAMVIALQILIFRTKLIRNKYLVVFLLSLIIFFFFPILNAISNMNIPSFDFLIYLYTESILICFVHAGLSKSVSVEILFLSRILGVFSIGKLFDVFNIYRLYNERVANLIAKHLIRYSNSYKLTPRGKKYSLIYQKLRNIFLNTHS